MPAGDDVVFRVEPNEGSLPESFTLPRRQIQVIDEKGATGASIPIYEFYWADLSASNPGWLGDIRRGWQLMAGLPRVGYPCLTLPESETAARWLARPGGFVDRPRGTLPESDVVARWLALVRAAYRLTWVLLVTRMVFVLACLGVLAYYRFKLTWLTYYDVNLVADIVVSIMCLALLAAVLGYAVARWRRCWLERSYRPFRVLGMGLAILGITALLTQLLTLAVFELSGLEPKAVEQEQWIKFENVRMLAGDAERLHAEPPYYPKPFSSELFYRATMWTGAVPYLLSALIVVWSVIVMGVFYTVFVMAPRFSADDVLSLAPREQETADRVRLWMNRVVGLSRAFWGAAGLASLFAMPILFLSHVASVKFLGAMPPRLFIDRPEFQTAYDRFAQYIVFIYIYNIAYVCFLVFWGAAAWPWLRATLQPALELTNDVTGYFPRIAGVDDVAMLRVILGGPIVEGTPPISRRLTDRLHAALASIHQSNGGPVVLVTHSLGTVIAALALDRWSGSESEGVESVPLELTIDLITMGSPLLTLAKLYPHLYGDQRNRGRGWSIPRVRRWFNLYHGGDLIGREVGLADNLGVEKEMVRCDAVLGHGGHGAYFADRRVAALVLDWCGLPGAGSQ
jgi:hypothetical protein